MEGQIDSQVLRPSPRPSLDLRTQDTE